MREIIIGEVPYFDHILRAIVTSEAEKVVNNYLRKEFLTRNKISVTKVLKDISGELSDLSRTGISKRALVNRIETIPDQVLKLKRHGGKAAWQA